MGANRRESYYFLPERTNSAQYHVNLRTDFAWGKDTFTWSVGVAEAF